MSSTNLLILRRPSQSLTRKPYIVPSTEVSVLGVDVDAIGTDSLGVATVFLLVLFGLWNQILRLIERIPANSVQEGKTIPYRNADLPQAEALRARAPNSKAALALPRAMRRTCRWTKFTIRSGMLCVLV